MQDNQGDAECFTQPRPQAGAGKRQRGETVAASVFLIGGEDAWHQRWLLFCYSPPCSLDNRAPNGSSRPHPSRMNSPTRIKKRSALMAGKRVFLRIPDRGDLEESLALSRASLRLHRGLVYPATQPAEFATFLERCRRADSVCCFVC